MRARKRQGGGQAIPHPPQIRPAIRWANRLRFSVTTAASQKVITMDNLFNTVLIATSATTGVNFFNSIRVKAVEVWGPSPAAGTATTVSVAFITDQTSFAVQGGDSVVFSDTSVSVEPAHVRAVPGKSLVSMFLSPYQSSSANALQLFLLTAPVGSVIDVEIEGLNSLGSNPAPLAVTQALVAATTGAIYYRGLDGLAVAGTTLPSILAGSSR